MRKLSTIVIYGYSGSGKTTLIVSLINDLTKEGHRVCTVKHKPAEISIDQEGKDTWKHVNAGSNLTAFSTNIETDFILPGELNLEKTTEIIGEITDCDLILAEGFKGTKFPKIAVGDIERKEATLIRYQDNIEDILEVIQQEIKTTTMENKLPGLDCGLCGHATCREMAEEIMAGNKELDDCQIRGSKRELELKVDGKEIPLEPFPANIIRYGLRGMLETLKGVDEDVQNISLEAEY